jgi:hypothetical protein
MPNTSGLADFLVRRLLTRPFYAVILSRGPVLTETNQIDEVLASDLAPPRFSEDEAVAVRELAEEIETGARSDATALRVAGPYFVSIRRTPDRPITERHPLMFPEAAPTESVERQTLLATQRELAIRQTEALTENQRVMLDWARWANSKSGEAEERLREDLLRERQHSITMGRLVVEGTQAQVAAAKDQSEALVQADARKREAFAMEQQRVAWTALLQQADVIVPAIASGFMAKNGAAGGPIDAVAEYKLLEELLQSLSPDQFSAIGARLPMHIRAGLMNIYQGKMVPALVPTAAAKLFAQVDQRLAFEIYAELDKSIALPQHHEGRAVGMDTEGSPLTCKTCGMGGDAPCNEPSRQQKLWLALVATKSNTMAARGEQAMKALGAK